MAFTALPTKIQTKTASYSLAITDGPVFFDATSGNLVATLPDATLAPLAAVYTVYKSDFGGNTLTINTLASQTVGGRPSADVILAAWQDYLQVQTDGANWQILNKVETSILQNANSGAPSAGGVYISAATDSMTLGIGKWRLRGYIYTNQGSGTGLAIGVGSGFYGATGTNTTTAPAAVTTLAGVKALFGQATYSSYSTSFIIGGGTTATNIREHGGFVEVVLVISTPTQIFFVPNTDFSALGSSSVNTYMRAERIW